MAERFVEVDRNTPMLLPTDLRDWVPEDDLVHFIIEAVKTLPIGEFMVNERGRGYAQYPPSMMLALLIYCYANGIFSSRLYFPRKNGHGKRLVLLTYFGLFGKQKVSSFACWKALSYRRGL
jgi:transposase